MNQLKKNRRRQQIREEESLESLKKDKERHIWDIDYLSTSDEEDNDSEEESEKVE